MPKRVDYPRASFFRALELAKGIDDLGGSCPVDLAADRIGMKVSGAFAALQSASVKHGFISRSSDRLEVTSLYKEYKLAYTDEEANDVLIQALMNVPLYDQILKRFNGAELPVSHLDRLLIREFDVPEKMSSRIKKYITDTTSQLGLIDSNNILRVPGEDRDDTPTGEDNVVAVTSGGPMVVPRYQRGEDLQRQSGPTSESYTIHVRGPGMDSVVTIDTKFDIEIVELILKKIAIELEAENEEEPSDSV